MKVETDPILAAANIPNIFRPMFPGRKSEVMMTVDTELEHR